LKRLVAFAVLLAACEGNAPNPRAGYVLQLTLGPRFDASLVTGARVVVDSISTSLPLGLQAGPGESVAVGAVQVTSRRTDIDGDGEVELVYEMAQSPWAAAARFDLPLRSPGYATIPFLFRIEALGASGVIGTVTVDRTPAGKALDFDLTNAVEIPVSIPCIEGKSCTGSPDGGVTDGGAADGGPGDGGSLDGGAPAVPRLVVAHDTNNDGVEETLSLLESGSLRTIATATEIDGFRWSPDGAAIYVLQATGTGSELTSVALVDGGTQAILTGSGLTGLTVSAAGNRVAARSLTDGGVLWHVRATAGADGGVDLEAVAGAPLAISPDGTEVAVPQAAGDGGIALVQSSSLSAEVRILAVLARLTAFLFSPAGGQIALVGAPIGETKASLFLASTLGDPLLRLVPERMAGEVRDAAFSRDGRRVGFRADLDTAGAVELWVASPALRNVSGGVAPDGGGVTAWSFDPKDAARVAFLSDRRTAGEAELYLTAAGGIPERLSADGLDGGVSAFAWNAAGTALAYRTSAGALHVARPGGPPRDLGAADAFSWSPDGRWLAVARGSQLFLVREDGSATQGPVATGLVERRFEWQP
jgi:hypothetical protein